MYEYSVELYQLCQAELIKIEEAESNNSSLNMIDLCFSAIEKVKVELKKTLFRHARDEMDFFKNVFPNLLAKAFYYIDRADLERAEFFESRKRVRDLIYEKKKVMDELAQKNADLFSYLKSGNEFRDEYYFKRSQTRIIAIEKIKGEEEVFICPDATMIWADYLADERLAPEIQANLGEGKSFLPEGHQTGKLKWTGTLNEFLDLIYGLHAMGCFNHGEISLDIVGRHFQKIFDFDQEWQGIDHGFEKIYTLKLIETLFNKNFPEEAKNAIETEFISKIRDFINSRLKWTGTVTDLVELIYGLHAAGMFNYGKATIKEIVHCFEQCFHINLGNTSSTFQRIKWRKSGPTCFIERLKNCA